MLIGEDDDGGGASGIPPGPKPRNVAGGGGATCTTGVANVGACMTGGTICGREPGAAPIIAIGAGATAGRDERGAGGTGGGAGRDDGGGGGFVATGAGREDAGGRGGGDESVFFGAGDEGGAAGRFAAAARAVISPSAMRRSSGTLTAVSASSAPLIGSDFAIGAAARGFVSGAAGAFGRPAVGRGGAIVGPFPSLAPFRGSVIEKSRGA